MQYVKSTMIDKILKIVAPHHCFGCDKTGTVLCDYCKYNIVDDSYFGCISCQKPTNSENYCGRCKTSYSRAWCVAERRNIMTQLLNAYKFENVYDAHRTFVDLLDVRLPSLPSSTIIVPIPTIAKHVRQRGYDHMRLIADSLATKRSLRVEHVLARAENSVQTGASRKQRYDQALRAFAVDARRIDSSCTYFLIDDVTTTGATLEHAAAALKKAGARDVWVAVIARQPFEN